MTLLTRLRALSRSKPASVAATTPATAPSQTDTTTPFSAYSQSFPPSPEVLLHSKIHPDINALVASIEDDDTNRHVGTSSNADASSGMLAVGLKPRIGGRDMTAGVRKGKGRERAEVDGDPASSSTSPVFDSHGGWSTFGREHESKRNLPDLREFGKGRKSGQRDEEGHRRSTSNTNTSMQSRPNTGLTASSIPLSKTPSRRSSGRASNRRGAYSPSIVNSNSSSSGSPAMSPTPHLPDVRDYLTPQLWSSESTAVPIDLNTQVFIQSHTCQPRRAAHSRNRR